MDMVQAAVTAGLDTQDAADLGQVPGQAWLVLGQRGLVIVCEHENEAFDELAHLDGKYLPSVVAVALVADPRVVKLRREF